MTQATQTIAFIGAGNMSGSLIGGMVKNQYPASQIIATARGTERLHKLQQELGIQISTNNIDAVRRADVIVLGVKPQMMADVCQPIREAGIDFSDKLFISVAAGLTVERLQQMLGQVAMVRTMPNTPSLLQLGATGLYASSQVSEEQKELAGMLMESVGIIHWCEQESGLNDIIAVTGSSPAYFFLFMQAMEAAARKLSFTDEQARALVQQAALGSAKMVIENPELDLATLRSNVTSKGGTTAEAIRTFQEGGLEQLVEDAMRAAIERAEQMEKEL